MQERIQKLIAQAGITSRRHAEELITLGEVTVNGKVVTELGTKADASRDHIKVHGKLINPILSAREKVYILLYKPRGFLSALSDRDKRPLVTDLLPASMGRLHPVGRLDFNTEGLIILTNDGEFTNFVTAAKNKVKKVYVAKVKGLPPEMAVERLRRGIILEDGVRTAPAKIKQLEVSDSNAWFEVILHEGRNQQIRKMFEAIGHSVVKLRRVAIGPLNNEILRPKEFRKLSPEEVARMMRPAPKRKPAPKTDAAGARSKKPVEGGAARILRPSAASLSRASSSPRPSSSSRPSSSARAGSSSRPSSSSRAGSSDAGSSSRPSSSRAGSSARSSSSSRTGSSDAGSSSRPSSARAGSSSRPSSSSRSGPSSRGGSSTRTPRRRTPSSK